MTILVALVTFITIFVLFIFGPSYPIFKLWHSSPSKWKRLLLGAMILSYVLFLVLFLSGFIGGHHHLGWKAIAQWNIWGSIFLSILAVIFLARKAFALVAGCWLTTIWLYVRFVVFFS